jgi:hypothetical protein
MPRAIFGREWFDGHRKPVSCSAVPCHPLGGQVSLILRKFRQPCHVPQWVKRRHRPATEIRLLYPQERTSATADAMSALGHIRTHAAQQDTHLADHYFISAREYHRGSRTLLFDSNCAALHSANCLGAQFEAMSCDWLNFGLEDPRITGPTNRSQAPTVAARAGSTCRSNPPARSGCGDCRNLSRRGAAPIRSCRASRRSAICDR